jgi:RNA polymerase sigma-70 factor (ECF subfamily)
MSEDRTYQSDERLYSMLRGNSREREAAFKELYSRYSSRIYLYCRKVMGTNETAEDLFQQTFLRFLQSAETERTMTNVPAYLLRIARNLCLNHKKKAGNMTVPLEDFQMPVEDVPLEDRELERMVTTALELLPEEYRDAFVLQAYNGLSYKEIGEVTNAPVTTVRNRVVRAKQKIREILAPYLADYRQ